MSNDTSKLGKHLMKNNQQMVTTTCGPWSALFSPEKCRHSVSWQTEAVGIADRVIRAKVFCKNQGMPSPNSHPLASCSSTLSAASLKLYFGDYVAVLSLFSPSI